MSAPAGRTYGDIFLIFYIFLNKKMNQKRKTPTQFEMIEMLRNGSIELPPLSFRMLEGVRKSSGNVRFDAIIEAL
jgi:hypothetical protein